MDAIKVDGEYYDPYFILGVTKNDDDKQITKAYKLRAKKFHPDKTQQENKKKYEKRFKIICKSYEYIKNKRSKYTLQNTEPPKNSEQDVIDHQLPNSYGYGETSRLQKIEDYDSADIKICKQLDGNDFDIRLFNRMFEQVQSIPIKEKNVGIIHKTTDGFIGYNTADTDNCNTVHTYKGLLVYGDDYGENGTGYWGKNYSDYKHSYNSAMNPTSKINVCKDDTIGNSKTTTRNDFNTYKNHRENDKLIPTMTNKQFHQDKLKRFLEEDEQNKHIVMKYSSLFDKSTLQSALEGQLETSTIGLFEMLSLE